MFRFVLLKFEHILLVKFVEFVLRFVLRLLLKLLLPLLLLKLLFILPSNQLAKIRSKKKKLRSVYESQELI